MFIESMKRGPRSKLNCNQKWAPILDELFHNKKPNQQPKLIAVDKYMYK